MGYASYAMYLFQNTAFTFFAPMFAIAKGRLGDPMYSRNIGNPNQWWERQPDQLKLPGVIIFTFLCWLVHRYYQDMFVPYVFGKLSACYKNKCASGCRCG
jgi:hypothetical protein